MYHIGWGYLPIIREFDPSSGRYLSEKPNAVPLLLPNDDEVDDFKDYLYGGGSYLDEIDRLMESEVECFRINRANNDDDEDNN